MQKGKKNLLNTKHIVIYNLLSQDIIYIYIDFKTLFTLNMKIIMVDDTLILLHMSILVRNFLASCKEPRLRKYVISSIIMPVLCSYYN